MDKRFNVGITTFGADGGKSGISQYIINLIAEFSKMKDRARFEVMTYENESEIFLSHKNGVSSLNFSNRMHSPLLNVAWHQFALPALCRKRKYDVLFLPAGNRRLPVWSPCPTVGTVHDFSSIHVKGKYDPARMFYITRVLPFLVKKLTRILTVSESSKRDIIEYAQVPEDRVTVTPLAADNNLYYPRDKKESTLRVAERFGIRRPYILFISRIEHPGKNHARLIRAFSRLKETEDLPHQLVLAGSDWSGAAEVHREASASFYANDVIFTGFVKTKDLPDLFCGSDLFMFPSLYEGFGLPVLEAMSCGVPVACSNVSSMPEVAHNAAYLFDPYEEDDIAEAMKRMINDTELSTHLAALGLERSKRFTWKRTAEMTMQIIRQAAEN